MDKAQALNSFWNSFGIFAYDENTVPKNAEMPYITYNVSTGKMEDIILLSASLWYHETSWKNIQKKADEIAEYIGQSHIIKLDKGYLYITQGTPFAQRMSDENPDIRRIYLNLAVEYLTAY
jgi:hypothetical protein